MIVAIAIILYFMIGILVCLCALVSPSNQGILGKIRRAIFTSLPNALLSLIKRILGRKIVEAFGKAKHYLYQTNHPLIQWLYFSISIVAFAVYSYIGIYRYMPNKYVSNYNVILAYAMAVVCYWIYYKTCSVSPGKIDSKNVSQYVQKYDDYYDGVLYKKDNKCKTCQIVKPARSKHCTICNICISKFDHHCVWIRQCVGQKNYKYFVSFLFLHSVWAGYLAFLACITLYTILEQLDFWDTTYNIGGQLIKGNNFLAFQYILITDTWLVLIIVMCVIISGSLLIFGCFHLSLIWTGQTTNQRIKRGREIPHLKWHSKEIKQFQKKNPILPAKFDYKGKQMTRKQFDQHKSDTNFRLQVLQKWRNKLGLFGSLKQICLEPDV